MNCILSLNTAYAIIKIDYVICIISYFYRAGLQIFHAVFVGHVVLLFLKGKTKTSNKNPIPPF